jgi:DNA-binding XRE family transcriptional regulator
MAKKRSAWPPNNILRYREAAKLTQEELGLRVGAPYQTIEKLEDGKDQLSFAWAELIAGACGVEPEDIAGDAYGWAHRLLFLRSKMESIRDIAAKP